MSNANQKKATLTLPSEKSQETGGLTAKEQAAAEEALNAQRMAQVKAMQEEPAAAVEPEQSLGAIASQGRDYLMQKLREHAEKQAKKAEEERPKPYVTPAMQAKIDAEIARGREVQARHQAQWDSRPQRKPEVWDGKNEVVARPNNLVPDPKATPTNTSVSGTFVAGHKQYSPNV